MIFHDPDKRKIYTTARTVMVEVGVETSSPLGFVLCMLKK